MRKKTPLLNESNKGVENDEANVKDCGVVVRWE